MQPIHIFYKELSTDKNNIFTRSESHYIHKTAIYHLFQFGINNC